MEIVEFVVYQSGIAMQDAFDAARQMATSNIEPCRAIATKNIVEQVHDEPEIWSAAKELVDLHFGGFEEDFCDPAGRVAGSIPVTEHHGGPVIGWMFFGVAYQRDSSPAEA